MSAIENLQSLLEQVENEETFLEFLAALGEDFAESRSLSKTSPAPDYCAAPLGWENTTLDRILEAAEAWARDSHGNPRLHPDNQNPWRRCAEILYAGKYYE